MAETRVGVQKERKMLNSQAREMVIQLRDYFERERMHGGPLLPFENVVERVANALNIGTSTVSRITREKYGESSREENKLSTPKKRKSQPIKTSIDGFTRDAIRSHIYGYYGRNELPTLNKLAISLKESDLLQVSRSSLWRIIKNMGFSFKQCDKRKIAMERYDIVLARCNFLRAAKTISDWNKVVFLDETWLNANHTVGKIWTDGTAQASTKVPAGKGERLIIVHAGSNQGFIPNCLLSFKSIKTNEYHEEMNFEKFKQWFLILLQNLKEPSIIIMDNAPYHSVQINKPPTSNNKKSELINWLQENNIPADMTMLKAELLHLVKLHKPPMPTYALDEMAKEAGHQVIRLPLYHCQYNAIELIWAQVKGFAARNNSSPPFTANKMQKLLEEACNNITANDWQNVIRKTKELIMADWDRDIHIDNYLDQQLIIGVGSSDSDETTSESDIGCSVRREEK